MTTLTEASGFLAPVLEVALDAVIVMDRDGVIADWNRQAEATFGWTRQEAVGRLMSDLIIPPALCQAHRDGLAHYLTSGEARVLGTRIEVPALTRNGDEITVELSISEAAPGLFVGFLRDISGRRALDAAIKRRTRDAELLQRVTALAVDCTSLEEAFFLAIGLVLEATEWEVGHALTESHGVLRSAGVWRCGPTRDITALRQRSEAMEFPPGTGLPGLALERREPVWFSAKVSPSVLPRRDVLVATGLFSAFGLPIMSDGRVVAVLEFFSTRAVEPDRDLVGLLVAVGDQVGRILERLQAAAQQKLLLDELNHRVKNNLAAVQSIAAQTLRQSDGPEAFVEAFNSRLSALAGAHDLLTKSTWQGVDLSDLLSLILGPYGIGQRVFLDGPAIHLAPAVALSLNLVFHELATNAAKYGGLSTPAARVSVRWSWGADPSRLALEWLETGGPPPAPGASGFGMRLIRTALERELGADLSMQFAPTGLDCRMSIPLGDKPPSRE